MIIRDLITLNHDRLLENLLISAGVDLSTGFDQSDGFNRKWNSELLDQNYDVRLLKLHGSIDWHRPKPVNTKFFPDVYQYVYKDRNDFLAFLKRRKEPFFLTGALNKTSEYTQGIFWELLIRFEEALRRSELLVVCGYSFGDQGVNHIIYNWIDKPSGTNVLVLTDEKEHLISRIEDHDIPKVDRSGVPRVDVRRITNIRKNLRIEEVDLRTTSWKNVKTLIKEW
ncbi:MAG: SIR2 family protein [candidate division Zixibacteria bacterium]|nr:SIR2 family protein [candidate division Zixibacteria bacterium]